MGKRASVRRVAFTLPSSTVADLSYVALRLGVNKSALLNNLVSETVADLRGVLFAFPDPLDRLDDRAKEELAGLLGGLAGRAQADAEALSDALQEGTGHG